MISPNCSFVSALGERVSLAWKECLQYCLSVFKAGLGQLLLTHLSTWPHNLVTLQSFSVWLIQQRTRSSSRVISTAPLVTSSLTGQFGGRVTPSLLKYWEVSANSNYNKHITMNIQNGILHFRCSTRNLRWPPLFQRSPFSRHRPPMCKW